MPIKKTKIGKIKLIKSKNKGITHIKIDAFQKNTFISLVISKIKSNFF